jgi:hypothetical protein
MCVCVCLCVCVCVRERECACVCLWYPDPYIWDRQAEGKASDKGASERKRGEISRCRSDREWLQMLSSLALFSLAYISKQTLTDVPGDDA